MDNELRGVLFKNGKKTEERQPDYKGEVTVNGQKYDVGSWIKKSKAGVPYMSLSLSLPRQQQKEPEVKQTQPAANDFSDVDDDLPF